MKIIKYFLVGSIAALTDISLFYLFAKLLGYNYLMVAFFSFIIATFENYILSIKYVFTSGIKYSKKMEISLIFIISGIAIIINQVSLYVLVEFFANDIVFSKIMATSITFFWNFIARNSFVFSESNEIEEPLLEPFLRKMRTKKVLSILKKYKNIKLLDIGCGRHYELLKAAESYIDEGYGIDCKVPDIHIGKLKTKKIKILKKLPFKDKTFDFVTMLAFLEHLDKPLIIIKEIERILKPKGKLLITVPSRYSKPLLVFFSRKLKIVSIEEINDHKKYYNFKDVEKLIKTTDLLRIDEHKYFQLFMNNFFIISKSFSKLKRIYKKNGDK